MGQAPAAGAGLGIAVHRSFVTYVATWSRSPWTPRATCRAACGYGDRLRLPRQSRTDHSQIEGAAIMGLSLARYGNIRFKDGRVEQSNFHDYQVVRIDECPR